LGIKVVIDKNYGNGKDQSNNLSDTLLQFIFNGLIFKKKFCLYFNFDNPTIKKLHENSQYLTNFKEVNQNYVYVKDNKVSLVPFKEEVLEESVTEEEKPKTRKKKKTEE
jgi:hypothetical protein